MCPAPRGTGTAQMEGKGLTALGFVEDGILVQPVAVPEDILPFIDEIGPGTAAWMHREPIRPGASVTVQVDAGEAGRAVHWQIWEAASDVPDLGDPLGGTPLEIIGPRHPGGITWGLQDEGNQTVDPDGIAQLSLTTNPQSQSAKILVASDDTHGGVATWILGISGESIDVVAIDAPEPGSEGNVAIQHRASLDNIVAGESLAWPFSDARAAPVLTRGDWAPAEDDSYRSTLDGRILRAQTDGAYRIGLMARDQTGYVTHAFEDRGIAMDIIAPTLGAGTDSTVLVRLTHLGSVPIAGAITFTVGDETFQDSFELLRGGRLDLQFPVTPTAPGALPLEASIDTGDVVAQHRETVTVLDADAYEKAEKRWYDPGKYVPAPLPVLALLAAVLLRKR